MLNACCPPVTKFKRHLTLIYPTPWISFPFGTMRYSPFDINLISITCILFVYICISVCFLIKLRHEVFSRYIIFLTFKNVIDSRLTRNILKMGRVKLRLTDFDYLSFMLFCRGWVACMYSTCLCSKQSIKFWIEGLISYFPVEVLKTLIVVLGYVWRRFEDPPPPDMT